MPYLKLWEQHYFSEVASDPRFQDLLDRMDFPQ